MNNKSKGAINKKYIIYILILVFIISIIFIILLIRKINKKKDVKQPIIIQEVYVPIKTLNISFPQCFELSSDAKQVYGILKGSNLDITYSRLLDAYSLSLCQLKDFKNNCDTKTMDQRITTLNNWNANQYNKDAINIVNSVTKITNNKYGQFLVQVCDICENQINNINNNINITPLIKTQIIGYNSEFYRTIFDQINTICI